VSAWVPGQLYVVSDSSKTIAASLPTSHSLSVKQYIRIADEEREAVKLSYSKLPNPGWVKIKQGKYKDDIGYVFDSEQSNDLVAVLIPPREFPYPMPRGSVALLDRSRLPNDKAVSDITRGDKVVGWAYKGERYYMGLLLKHFHRDRLELITYPHADDIQLHLQSEWDNPFFKKSLVSFSMQFLRVGDAARVISGEVCSEIGTVVSTDHMFGSVRLALTLDGHKEEIEVRLQDVERVFCVGDTVRVVAGSYLGLEGHIIQMNEGLFHVCQAVSNEEVNSKNY
jgi:ribosomal protein L24